MRSLYYYVFVMLCFAVVIKRNLWCINVNINHKPDDFCQQKYLMTSLVRYERNIIMSHGHIWLHHHHHLQENGKACLCTFYSESCMIETVISQLTGAPLCAWSLRTTHTERSRNAPVCLFHNHAQLHTYLAPHPVLTSPLPRATCACTALVQCCRQPRHLCAL